MSDTPGFLSNFKPPEELPLVKETRQVTKTATPSKISYTARDHECLELLIAHSFKEGFSEISNSRIGKAMSMSTGAAASRVGRLVKMGVIKPWYDVAVETGKVNRRVIEILKVPPAPWEPER